MKINDEKNAVYILKRYYCVKLTDSNMSTQNAMKHFMKSVNFTEHIIINWNMSKWWEKMVENHVQKQNLWNYQVSQANLDELFLRYVELLTLCT